MVTIALIPLVLISLVFAEPIVSVLGGKGYTENEAPNLFRIYMLIGLLYPADRFFALALDVIHKPKVNFYKILVMLLVNVLAVSIGISIYHSLYTIAIASLFPPLVAILMTYYPLKGYYKFNFWDIYLVGYQEIIVFIKQVSRSVFRMR